MIAYSERYNAALTLAAAAHQGQMRKGSDVPYIVHPVHVSTILLRHGFSEDVVIAGLLHDVVEDQDVPLADIEADFGFEVAEMVAVLTEQKREGDVERPWEVRKQEALSELQRASPEAVAAKAADVIHNAHALAADLRRDGPVVWRRFKRGPEETIWYYRSVAEIVRSCWGTHPLCDELEGAIQDLERAVAQAG
jgi:(p)ppGpp synthase/HD superfamily hydrolase